MVDEIEAAGCVPKLVQARKAKLMLGMINKTDTLDTRGLNRLQRTGSIVPDHDESWGWTRKSNELGSRQYCIPRLHRRETPRNPVPIRNRGSRDAEMTVHFDDTSFRPRPERIRLPILDFAHFVTYQPYPSPTDSATSRQRVNQLLWCVAASTQPYYNVGLGGEDKSERSPHVHDHSPIRCRIFMAIVP